MEVSNFMKFYWDIELIKFLIFDNKQFDAYEKIPLLNGLDVMEVFQDNYLIYSLKVEISIYLHKGEKMNLILLEITI